LYRNPSTGELRNFHAKHSRSVRQRALRDSRSAALQGGILPPPKPGPACRRQAEARRYQSEAAMEEREIKAYFEHQVRLVIERSAAEPEGFLAYFSSHEPKDEEILGLLAVSTMMTGEFHRGDSFPTPVEALAALSGTDRKEICNFFRNELRNCLRHIGTA
jgi:hypothetical protein